MESKSELRPAAPGGRARQARPDKAIESTALSFQADAAGKEGAADYYEQHAEEDNPRAKSQTD